MTITNILIFSITKIPDLWRLLQWILFLSFDDSSMDNCDDVHQSRHISMAVILFGYLKPNMHYPCRHCENHIYSCQSFYKTRRHVMFPICRLVKRYRVQTLCPNPSYFLNCFLLTRCHLCFILFCATLMRPLVLVYVLSRRCFLTF